MSHISFLALHIIIYLTYHSRDFGTFICLLHFSLEESCHNNDFIEFNQKAFDLT